MHPKVITAVAAAAALTFTGSALATGGSHRAASADRVVKLSATTTHRNIVDTGQPGFTIGDYVALSNDLTRRGKPAGIDGVVCTIVRVADAQAQSGTAQCQIVYRLTGGQVSAQGLFTLTEGGFEGTQYAAITGGTGGYRGAGGDAKLTFVRPGAIKIALDMRR